MWNLGFSAENQFFVWPSQYWSLSPSGEVTWTLPLHSPASLLGPVYNELQGQGHGALGTALSLQCCCPGPHWWDTSVQTCPKSRGENTFKGDWALILDMPLLRNHSTEQLPFQGSPQPTLWFLAWFLCFLEVHLSAGAWETILIPQVADEPKTLQQDGEGVRVICLMVNLLCAEFDSVL